MSTSRQRPVDTRTLATRGAGALAIALVVNFALGWIALSQNLLESTEFFKYPGIAVWTFLGIGGATIVYGLLTRRFIHSDRIFVRVAVLVLVLSFAPNIALVLGTDSVTASEGIGLMALHVPPAIVAVLALPETPLGR